MLLSLEIIIPGVRIGWAIPGKFNHQVKQVKRMLNISCPTLTQASHCSFFKAGRYEYHLKNLRKALHTQCLRYMQAIIEHFPADTKISRPHGGFVLWLQLNKKINSFKLRTEAMKHQISIVPGRIFSANCNYSQFHTHQFWKTLERRCGLWIDDAGKIDQENDVVARET